jgi:hypothetical protein
VDINSSIKISATGADQAAKEIGKLGKAYEEVGKAANGVTSGKGSRPIGGEAIGIPVAAQNQQIQDKQEHARQRQEGQSRERANRSQGRDSLESTGRTGFGVGESLAGRSDVLGAMGRGSEALGGYLKSKGSYGYGQAPTSITPTANIPQVSLNGGQKPSQFPQFPRPNIPRPSGDKPSEGGESGGGGGSSAMMKAGAAVAVAGMAFNFLSSSASKEFQLNTAPIYSTGMGQRLGAGYDPLRNYRINSMRSGVPVQNMDSYLSALGMGGGRFDTSSKQAQAATAAVSDRNIATATTYGIDAGAVGSLQAKLHQAGGGSVQGSMLGSAQFQGGLKNQFVENVSGAIEQGMQRGMKAGSKDLVGMGTEMASLQRTLAAPTREGGVGMTATGAMTSATQLQGAFSTSSSRLSSPEDFQRFMMFHKKGESYFDTVKKMNAPTSYQDMMKMSYERSGGDKDNFMSMMLGFMPSASPQQLEGYYDMAKRGATTGKWSAGSGLQMVNKVTGQGAVATGVEQAQTMSAVTSAAQKAKIKATEIFEATDKKINEFFGGDKENKTPTTQELKEKAKEQNAATKEKGAMMMPSFAPSDNIDQMIDELRGIKRALNPFVDGVMTDTMMG